MWAWSSHTQFPSFVINRTLLIKMASLFISRRWQLSFSRCLLIIISNRPLKFLMLENFFFPSLFLSFSSFALYSDQTQNSAHFINRKFLAIETKAVNIKKFYRKKKQKMMKLFKNLYLNGNKLVLLCKRTLRHRQFDKVRWTIWKKNVENLLKMQEMNINNSDNIRRYYRSTVCVCMYSNDRDEIWNDEHLKSLIVKGNGTQNKWKHHYNNNKAWFCVVGLPLLPAHSLP